VRRCPGPTLWLVGLVALLACAAPGVAEDREYYLRGAVEDTSKQPIAGADIVLRERASRRTFRTSSDTAGKFKLVGLPHGVYEVAVGKAGYKTRTLEWDLSEAQDRLKKVEFTPVALLSESQLNEIERSAMLKALLAEATKSVGQGDFDAALGTLEKMLAEQPDDVNALYLSGLCQLQKGQLAAAATNLGRVIERAPSFAAAHLQLAICFERLGDAQRALSSYEATLALEPGNEMALYNAGVLHYNAGRVTEALPYFEKGVAARPDDDKALEMAGYCLAQMKRYTEALDRLERCRAVVSDPERAKTLDELLASLRARVKAAPAANGG
jgi:tetratricopeptide (TPR) repeat protein